jgi:MFS family permease
MTRSADAERAAALIQGDLRNCPEEVLASRLEGHGCGNQHGCDARPDDIGDRPPWSPATSSLSLSRSSLRALAREPSFRQLYVAGFLSSLVLLVPVVHMIPHAVRAGVAPREAAWLISILGFGSLAGRLVLGHAADRLGRQGTLGALHIALGLLFLIWTINVGFVIVAFFAFAYGVCYGATIALRPAVIADNFAGPNLAAVTGLHYTSSVLGPLVGPAAFGYSVDFWNSDVIASCVAAVCLVVAGYFFGAKPPRVPLGHCQLSRPRAPFAARSVGAGQHNRRAKDFPTGAAAPPTQRAYHGRLS